MSTTKDEALKLALEALEESNTDNDTMEFHDRKNKAITAIKQALLTATPLAAPYVAPQLVQEPIAYLHQCGKKPELKELSFKKNEPLLAAKGYKAIPLTSPPAQRKPLTDEEIWREYRFLWPFHPEEERKLASDILEFARAIEAKLKEKNNGN